MSAEKSAGSARASGLIEVIAAVVKFILDLILDVLCTLLLIGMIAFWRWPWILDGYKCEHRWEYRLLCAVTFAAMWVDLATFLIFPVTLLSWRGPLLVLILVEEGPPSFRDVREERLPFTYNWRFRGFVWSQFGRFLWDIPFFCMMLFTMVVTPWNNYFLWPQMSPPFEPLSVSSSPMLWWISLSYP
jgi:hypothetical protein